MKVSTKEKKKKQTNYDRKEITRNVLMYQRSQQKRLYRTVWIVILSAMQSQRCADQTTDFSQGRTVNTNNLQQAMLHQGDPPHSEWS